VGTMKIQRVLLLASAACIKELSKYPGIQHEIFLKGANQKRTEGPKKNGHETARPWVAHTVDTIRRVKPIRGRPKGRDNRKRGFRRDESSISCVCFCRILPKEELDASQ